METSDIACFSCLTSSSIAPIVLSTDALQHDVDAAAFGYAPGVIPQMPVSNPPIFLFPSFAVLS